MEKIFLISDKPQVVKLLILFFSGSFFGVETFGNGVDFTVPYEVSRVRASGEFFQVL